MLSSAITALKPPAVLSSRSTGLPLLEPCLEWQQTAGEGDDVVLKQPVSRWIEEQTQNNSENKVPGAFWEESLSLFGQRLFRLEGYPVATAIKIIEALMGLPQALRDCLKDRKLIFTPTYLKAFPQDHQRTVKGHGSGIKTNSILGETSNSYLLVSDWADLPQKFKERLARQGLLTLLNADMPKTPEMLAELTALGRTNKSGDICRNPDPVGVAMHELGHTVDKALYQTLLHTDTFKVMSALEPYQEDYLKDIAALRRHNRSFRFLHLIPEPNEDPTRRVAEVFAEIIRECTHPELPLDDPACKRSARPSQGFPRVARRMACDIEKAFGVRLDFSQSRPTLLKA